MCRSKPVIVSTWSFGEIGNKAAWPLLEGGGSALDAVVTAANAVENDPRVDSVGLGGLPDEWGDVHLDSAVMTSPARWGSVLSVRHFQNPSSIARRLMERFGRAIRSGDGAEQFALAEGFSRCELLTESARNWWREVRDATLNAGEMPAIPFYDAGDGSLFLSAEERLWASHDTVGILALDSHGEIAAATSTSGTPFKPPGRIGDSAIPGHGLFVQPGVAAAAATGTGELISGYSATLRLVDWLSSMDMESALQKTMEMISSANPLEHEQAAFICITAEGEIGAASLRPGFRYCVTSAEGTRTVSPILTHFDDR